MSKWNDVSLECRTFPSPKGCPKLKYCFWLYWHIWLQDVFMQTNKYMTVFKFANFHRSPTDSCLLDNKHFLGMKTDKLINDCIKQWNSMYNLICWASEQINGPRNAETFQDCDWGFVQTSTPQCRLCCPYNMCCTPVPCNAQLEGNDSKNRHRFEEALKQSDPSNNYFVEQNCISGSMLSLLNQFSEELTQHVHANITKEMALKFGDDAEAGSIEQLAGSGSYGWKTAQTAMGDLFWGA